MDLIKLSSNTAYKLDNLVEDILKNRIRKIVVMTGAGISTPSGIPDFRSPGTGLYCNLSKLNLPYPEAVFEKSYFRLNPKPFFTLAKDLIPNMDKYKPNKIHYFLRLLQEKSLLHRLYTQNIDGLECISGIKRKHLIEAHGSFRTAKCINCKSKYSGLYVKNEILNDKIPYCKLGRCGGVIKPDIVFFEENLPEPFHKMHESDLLTADCVIVMGTSLEVEPFADIVKKSRFNVPRLLMNKHSVGPFKRCSSYSSSSNRSAYSQRRKDLQLLGDLIKCVECLVEHLGWTDELNELISNEMSFIEINKHTLIDTHYFKFKSDDEDNENENNTRHAKTSLEKRNETSAEEMLIRKLKRTTLAERAANRNGNKLNSVVKVDSRPKTTIFRNFNMRRATRKDKRTDGNKDESQDSSDSTSESSSDETNTNTKKPAHHSTTKVIKKFEFNLKCGSSVKSIPIEIANLNYKTSNKKLINSTLSLDESNQAATKSNLRPNFQTYFYGNKLFRANSKPLVVKQIENDVSQPT